MRIRTLMNADRADLHGLKKISEYPLNLRSSASLEL
jgi:hypothetical protein